MSAAPSASPSAPLRVLFAGTPDVAVPTLRALAGSRHDVVAALTRPPARRSRRGHDEPSPMATAAAELGVDVLDPPSVRDPSTADAIRALRPDVAVVVAFGALLPDHLLAIPGHGWINLHFSVLPAWRGAAPVQHAIWHGDEVTGATTFRITTGLDEGPVYGVLTERIRPRDTSGDLLGRLAEAGPRLVLDTLDAVADGSALPQEQPGDGVSLAPRITPEQGRVRWSDPALAVDRQIRACTPAPGAWTALAGTRVKIGPVVPVAAAESAPQPGRIVVEPRRVLVGTGSGPVELGRLAPAGKSWMDAAAWARGARLADDAAFDAGAPDGVADTGGDGA